MQPGLRWRWFGRSAPGGGFGDPYPALGAVGQAIGDLRRQLGRIAGGSDLGVGDLGRVRFRTGRFGRSRPLGRSIVGAVVGLGFGLAWGFHLADRSGPPKLLWVSIVLAAVALALIRSDRASDEREPPSFWRRLVVPPWRWPNRRLADFAAMNAAIAAGIAIGYFVG